VPRPSENDAPHRYTSHHSGEATVSLQDKLDAFKADYIAGKTPYNAPPEIHPIMARATKELTVSNRAGRALKVGDMAPTFSLEDPEGKVTSSSDLLARGPLVVSFYRGVWCPYCNMELQALQETLPQLQAFGASVVAISPQMLVNNRKSVRTNQLSFPVLSDPRNEVAAEFGLRVDLPDYLIDVFKNLKNDLPAFNGDDSWTLPMPGRYVTAQDGTIVYAEVNPDYTHRPDPSEMLPVLRGLNR
jgi:peroxiredoxin